MALIPGTRLGIYEVTALLGAGGMGEVYCARDHKLDRNVAIKVLPDTLAHDPDRLARLEREAKALAALNHPNIAHIYGFEDSAGVPALVMELVEGPTLADRIARGRIPIDEALPIARQIANGLEAAHEHGIIHRDLKPANIKVRDDGTVKVLDFGLAKALDPAPESPDAMNSPTLTARATHAGMILGTSAYMAPEQARGRSADRRADVWAFGVVLYEMLTGRRAFEGEDVSVTLASVLKDDVDWEALPPELPAPIRRVLRRCLEKDRGKRLSAIADARLELDDASLGREVDAVPAGRAVVVSTPTTEWRRALPWTLAVAATAALVAVVVSWAPWRPAPKPASRRLLSSIGADVSMPMNLGASAILSPDGTLLVFVAQQGGHSRLFARRLDQLQATALPDTDDAFNPFFSPDGRFVGFFDGIHLKKVAVAGGAAMTLCDATSSRGATWAEDDTIVFSPSSARNSKLLRVSVAGGTPSVFGTLTEGAMTQRWPQALPGGRDVLYTEHSAAEGFDLANLVVAPLSGGPPKVVLRGGYYGRYVPSGPRPGSGHLIYVQQGTLFAVPFDLTRLETSGSPAAVLEAFATNPTTGGAQIAFSMDGTLAYVPGAPVAVKRSIDWLARDGSTSVLRAAPSSWTTPRFSPDGQRLALAILTGKQRNIWIYDPARETTTQLTFEVSLDLGPAWSPDGKRIVFSSDRGGSGVYNLYVVNADGSGGVTRLTESPNSQLNAFWHPAGTSIAFDEARKDTKRDILRLPLQMDSARGSVAAGSAAVVVGTSADEFAPAFSPDGHWMAYESNEIGTNEVFVRPFPEAGGKWRVSTAGALYPRWSQTSRELLFLSPTQNLVLATRYSATGDTFAADAPHVWSPTKYQTLPGNNLPYDLHPDGKRLALLASKGQDVVEDKVVIVSSFFDDLRRSAPAR